MTNFIFSNHDTVKLAQKYGTPLYVISENIIRENALNIIQAFDKQQVDYKINYAGKAFLNIAMCKIVEDLGLFLDVVSGGELYTAYKSGFPMERVCMHGSNKSEYELKMAIDYNVGSIVVDSEYELKLLNSLCQKKNKVMDILIRISPGIEAHTHEYVQTGRVDSKFGIPLRSVHQMFKNNENHDFVNIMGLHCHIGSQIFDERPFLISTDIMLELIKDLRKMGIEIQELNLGGGFGIPYLKDDALFDIDIYIEKLVKVMKNRCKEFNISMPRIIVEPGRYIIGTAGITLYEIGTIKEIPHTRKYISVDGGMTDNPRPALYNALYHAVIANKMNYNEDEEELVTISGRCCETDTLIMDILLPQCEVGDILAVLHTGAYNYAMASNYNRLPKPAVVLLNEDKDELMVERETYEDMIAKDKLPSWL
ncbi:MAG: diaminopimelate decarboxylase [Eubacteriales bacterium]